MKKRIVSMLVAVAVVILMIPTVFAQELKLNLHYIYRYKEVITDEKLAEMVQSGEIPKDVAVLYLWGHPISDFSPLKELPNLRVLGVGRISGDSLRPIDLTPLIEFPDLQRIELPTRCFRSQINVLSSMPVKAFREALRAYDARNSINNVLEILKFISGRASEYDNSDIKPTIFDAVDILKSLSDSGEKPRIRVTIETSM